MSLACFWHESTYLCPFSILNFSGLLPSNIDCTPPPPKKKPLLSRNERWVWIALLEHSALGGSTINGTLPPGHFGWSDKEGGCESLGKCHDSLDSSTILKHTAILSPELLGPSCSQLSHPPFVTSGNRRHNSMQRLFLVSEFQKPNLQEEMERMPM